MSEQTPIEIWERTDGWTLEVYSKDPLDVSRIPLIVFPHDSTYQHFVQAARANGYGKKEP